MKPNLRSFRQVGKAGAIWTIKNTKEKVSVSGKKTWDDTNDQDGKRPEKIKVNLLADGKVVQTKEVSAKDDWKYSFDNLAKKDNGKDIKYTVTEDQVRDYTTKIEGYNITNSYIPGKTSLRVTKVWDDNNDQAGLRPNSIKVQLYADGKAKGEPIELNADNKWTYAWSELAEKENGKAITYTVKEVGEVKGYTAVVSDSK